MSNPTEHPKPSFLAALDLPADWHVVWVDLTNVDGNAFSLLAHVTKAVRRNKANDPAVVAGVLERYAKNMTRYTYDEHLRLLGSDEFVSVTILDDQEDEDEDEGA